MKDMFRIADHPDRDDSCRIHEQWSGGSLSGITGTPVEFEKRTATGVDARAMQALDLHFRKS